MFLDNLTARLQEEPRFDRFLLVDVNPQSGNVKRRRIAAPNHAMRILHRRLQNHVRSLIERMPPPGMAHSTGASPGDSPLKNVSRHRENRFFFLTDIHSAYPSVDGRRLAQVLTELDGTRRYREEEMYDFLCRYCLERDGVGLIIGAPASPTLFNVFAAQLIDQRVARLARPFRFAYTRYLDDFTLSSPCRLPPRSFRDDVRSALINAGFSVSHHKSFVLDLGKGPIIITGIGLELGGRLFIPRRFVRILKIHMRLVVNDEAVASEVIARIFGWWGAFRAVTGRITPLNRTEEKLFALYKECRHHIRRRYPQFFTQYAHTHRHTAV